MIAAGMLAEAPALPLHTAGKYVAGAYVVLFALVLIYVAIMSIRLSRIDAELGELLRMSERPAAQAGEGSDGGEGHERPGELGSERESAPA